MNFYELNRQMRLDEFVGASIAQSAGQPTSFLNTKPFNPAKFANIKGYDAAQFQELVTSFLGQFNISPEAIKPELDALTKKATDTFTAVQQQKQQAATGFTQPGAAGTV